MLKIQIATTALAMASARNTCGMLSPGIGTRTPNNVSCCICSAMPTIAAMTMNIEFWMLSPAMTRDSSALGVRLWISANSGTTNRPVHRPMPTKSSMIRQLPAWCTNWPMPSPACSAPPGRAKYRSSMNALMPNAPSGTRPISTVRPDSFSHSSEPVPVPIENSARAKMYRSCAPPRLSSA